MPIDHLGRVQRGLFTHDLMPVGVVGASSFYTFIILSLYLPSSLPCCGISASLSRWSSKKASISYYWGTFFAAATPFPTTIAYLIHDLVCSIFDRSDVSLRSENFLPVVNLLIFSGRCNQGLVSAQDLVPILGATSLCGGLKVKHLKYRGH